MTIHPLQRPLPAVAGAALLAVGLVTIAPESAPPVARAGAHAVQLRAVVATEAIALLNTAGVWTAAPVPASVVVTDPDVGAGTPVHRQSAEGTLTPAGSALLYAINVASAVGDLVQRVLIALALTPVSVALLPFWAWTGFPGPASGLQPWEPGSDCGGAGYAGRCILRAISFSLVPGPYVSVANSARNLVSAVFPSLRPQPAAADAVVDGVAKPVVVPAPDGSSKPGERRKRPERGGVKPAQAAAVHAVSGAGKSSAKADRSGSGRR